MNGTHKHALIHTLPQDSMQYSGNITSISLECKLKQTARTLTDEISPLSPLTGFHSIVVSHLCFKGYCTKPSVDSEQVCAHSAILVLMNVSGRQWCLNDAQLVLRSLRKCPHTTLHHQREPFIHCKMNLYFHVGYAKF